MTQKRLKLKFIPKGSKVYLPTTGNRKVEGIVGERFSQNFITITVNGKKGHYKDDQVMEIVKMSFCKDCGKPHDEEKIGPMAAIAIGSLLSRKEKKKKKADYIEPKEKKEVVRDPFPYNPEIGVDKKHCSKCDKLKKNWEKFQPLLDTINDMGYKITSFSYYEDPKFGKSANLSFKY